MKRRYITATALTLLLALLLPACQQQDKVIQPSQMSEVITDNLILSISADGNLDMPNESKLKFGTPGTVKDIFVVKGQAVKAGTLLAKLDNSSQLLNVEAAQYSLELAINNVIQTCCGTRYPTFYSLATALLRFEQAQDEINLAKSYLISEKYFNAASNLSLAKYDLSAARAVYADPKLDTFQTQYDNGFQISIPNYPALINISNILDGQIQKLSDLQSLIEAGDYQAALTALDSLSNSLYDTHSLVKNNSRLPGTYTYPDTSTSLAVSRQVLDSLSELQDMLYQPDFDRVKFSEKLRMAQHDLEMANLILDENETIYRAGLSPQTLRSYNINIENAMINLDKAKQELLKTEIMAPFDGTVVAIDVKENDQLSAFDYSAKTAVHLVDTKTIKMTGIIDEIDITKVAVGQDANITVDALPGQKLKGHVTFVSPFGTLQTGVVNFPVEIYLDPLENTPLRGGLTATAEIITGTHENVLIVPNRAIKGVSGNYYAEVVTDASKGKTEKRTVTIGLQNRRFTEITSGLNEGELVLIETLK